MTSTRVLIVAVPYVYATALATCFALDGAYELVVPDIAGGEPIPTVRFDVVLIGGAAPDVAGDVVIQLPDSFEDPVVVTGGGSVVPVLIDAVHPIEELVRLVGRCVGGVRPGPSRSTD